MQDFLAAKEKSNAIAETILFIWIAQHAAFSGLHLKVEDILAIHVTDIDFADLTISIKNQEIHITGGLNEILRAWLGETERKNKRRLFKTISYDLLEDTLGRVSSKFYGSVNKLLPRDFLEKVHVVAGARIPLNLRRQIMPHEEIGLHRDAYPQVVVALQGGVITRLEADGSTVDVNFPTGKAVVREIDPPDQLHKSVNNSTTPVELIIIQLKD